MATRGSVYPYDGPRGRTWTAHVTFRRAGKRQQRKVGGHRTKAEAHKTLTELLASIDAGAFVPSSRLTVGDYFDAWVDAQRAAGRRASTIREYRGSLRRYIDDELRAVGLQDLTALHLDAVYGRLRDRVSARTIRQLHAIVRKALEDARRKGVVIRNVADSASPPRTSATRAPQARAWTPAELRRFLDAIVDDETFGVAYRFAAMTGVRRSELLGLRWSALDLRAGRANITQTVMAADGAVRFDDVKTARSRRTIDVDPTTIAALRAHRARQHELRLLVGAGWVDNDLVFCAPDGRPWHPDSISSAFTRAIRDLEVPRIRFHDLRHTHASHLLAAGVNVKLVSERLGHSSVSFTLDVYSHVLPGQQAEAAAAAAALVDG